MRRGRVMRREEERGKKRRKKEKKIRENGMEKGR